MGTNFSWPWPKDYYENAATVVKDVLRVISSVRVRKYHQAAWMISARLKSNDSIRAKLERKQSGRPDYNIGQITDLSGVRVIVESVACARKLEYFLRTRSLFVLREGDSENFIDYPRADGYRGIHLVLDVQPPLPGKPSIPLELQIRTILQHQWSELSHSEFYKSVSEIPEGLLARMRALSEILHCAEIESDQLRRGRALDECRLDIKEALREKVLEKLRDIKDPSDAEKVGLAAIELIEFDGQIRRCLVSDGESQDRAFEALVALGESVKISSPELTIVIESILQRIEILVKVIPDEKEWSEIDSL